MSREFMGRRKDMYMLVEEIDPLLDRALSMLDEGRANRRRLKKESEGGPPSDEDV
jgi:hypothetical protein